MVDTRANIISIDFVGVSLSEHFEFKIRSMVKEIKEYKKRIEYLE
jgi:hypothetical protein